MGKLASVLVDRVADVNGVEMPYDEGIVWIVARWGNPNFTEELNKRLANIPDWERRNDTDIAKDAVRIAAGKCVLVGWKNLEDEEGNPIPYSSEQSVKYCKDPTFEPVYREIVAFAMNANNYRSRKVEEITGN